VTDGGEARSSEQTNTCLLLGRKAYLTKGVHADAGASAAVPPARKRLAYSK